MIYISNNKKIGKSIAIVLVIAFIAFTLSGCVDDGKKTINIKGSSTVLPIAETCAEKFMEENSDIQVTVAGGGSSVGIKSVASGEVDIGDASREAKDSDFDDIDGVELSDLVDNIVAYDGIAVVVSPEIYETVTELTMEQIYMIYSGEIEFWNEVGGPEEEIYVNDRASTSGTRATFVELIENSDGDALEDFEEEGGTLAFDNVCQENSNVVTAVSGSDKAIGYVGLGYVDPDNCPAIMIDGIEATVDTVKNNEYPISRSLHMYTLGDPTGIVKDFIDFVQSSEGQQVVEDEGFIPIS